MDIIIEYKHYYPEGNEITNILDKTSKDYAQKYEKSAWYRELKYNTQLFD